MARKRRKKNKNKFDDLTIDIPSMEDSMKEMEEGTFANIEEPVDYVHKKKKPKVKKPVQHMQMGPALSGIHNGKENKIMEDGKTEQDFKARDFSHKNNNKPKLRPGSKNKTDADVKTDPAPKGYYWKTYKNAEHDQKVMDFENSDIFSDFHGNFFLKKVGNIYKCWIEPISAQVYDKQGDPAKKITDSSPICVNTWKDPDGKRSFALASIAAYFAKHNITEDRTYHPHIYTDVNMGCGDVKYWNILDGGNLDSKPHVIAHAGESIVIDTGSMKVHKADGQDLTKYTSFGSTFPPLQGGQLNNVNFFPSQGSGCDVDVEYIPRIR